MSDPISFPSSTPVVGMPLLMPGQAQKEFTVNQALSVLDALYPRAIKSSQPGPSATAAESDCYRVTAPATGIWAGREDCIAVMIAGDWQFIEPAQGMTLFDQAADHALVFRSGWRHAEMPPPATGGSVVDTEARAAFSALVQALEAIGLLSTATP